MVQMSRVLEYAHKHPVLRRDTLAEAITESNTSGDGSAPFATLDQTVSALKGDVPEGA